MEKVNQENSQTSPFSATRKEAQEPTVEMAGEIARMRETVEQTKSEAQRTRLEVERQQSDFESQRRKTRALWVFIMLLAAALIGMSWYSLPLLQEQSTLLAQLPSMQDTLTAIGKRMDSAEGKLLAWASDRDKLGAQMAQLEKRVNSNLRIARKQAQEVAAQIGQRVQAELDKRTEVIQARLGRLESTQDSDRARVAQLQEDIVRVREEMVQQASQLRQDTQRGLGDLDQRMAWSKRELEALGSRLDRQRIDFEVRKNQALELAPGISLTVTGTNVSYQRITGWLRLVPEGRTLWVRGQGIQQPVLFYTQKDDRVHELVFTRVTKNDVLGYFLVPRRAGITASAPAAEDAELSTSVGSPD